MKYISVILTALCFIVALTNCFVSPNPQKGGWVSATIAWYIVLAQEIKNLKKKDGIT